MNLLTASAQARIGLLGNPSDIYGGYGLGFSVAELGCTVTLSAAGARKMPNELFEAAWQLFSAELVGAGLDPDARPFALTFDSNVPFQGGLSGSSALVIAAIRAWSRWYGLPMGPSPVAEMAFRVENEVLGIRAGALDRLVQSHDGLLAMDFQEPFVAGAVERLDASQLPPLLLAWHGVPGTHSGDIHGPMFARWQAGDAEVRETMDRLAANARDGQRALEDGDRARFLACIDRNFDLRSQVFTIADADRELIELGRQLGASAKFPGSGGAVLFACRDEDHLAAVAAACARGGHQTLRPSVHVAWPQVRAVFLAAGFATRLYPLTKTKAKPLLEVGGKPMLTRIVDQVVRAGGVVDGVVVANQRFYPDFVAWEGTARAPLPMKLVDDGATSNETRLGAIRDLALALQSSATPLEPDGYLVLACDNLFDFDLSQLIDRFRTTGCGQLIVREVPTPVPSGRYSEVLLEGDKVARFREKPAKPESNLSAIAVYLLPKELPALVASYLDSGGNPDAPGHFLAWLSERMPLQATPLTGSWLDIGSVEDLERAQATFRDPD